MSPIVRLFPLLRPLGLAAAALLMAGAAQAEYRLSSGDVIDVTIYRVPDLSRQLTVDVTGRIAFPPVGAIQADGATLDELGHKIRAALQDEAVLTDAQVTVGLVTARPVVVGGDVATPGTIPYQHGITVRRAIALAGGVGLSRIRGMEEVAELRSERDVIALTMTQALARAARLEAELAGKPDTALALPGPLLVSPSQRDEIVAAETRKLAANIAESTSEKTHLGRSLEIIDAHIAALRSQSELQQRIISQQVEEIDRQRQMMDQGLTNRARVLEERRALESTQERASDTESDISRAYDEREDVSYRVSRFDERRHAELDAALTEARQDAEAARARLSGVTERLAQLGMQDATDVKVAIFRKGPDGDVSVPAAQDTLLEPGDMLEITIDLSRLAIQPSSLMASQ